MNFKLDEYLKTIDSDYIDGYDFAVKEILGFCDDLNIKSETKQRIADYAELRRKQIIKSMVFDNTGGED